ncbi:MAG: Ig-like domain-containing protein [Alphaproteobacteria bacterium]|nr:Ig-like domain-containing protein [Alphaproteobacteria bacterium]
MAKHVQDGLRSSPPRILRTSTVGSLIAILLTILFVPAALGQTLVSLEHHVVGARLRVDPGELFVPKSIPGSLMVELVSADGTRVPELDRMVGGAYVEAVLRGPAFPAYRLLGLPNEPLMLPPLPLVGEYQIDDIRLVDLATGSELMTGSPSQIAVHVFPEVLVSRVESRPLSLDEIHAKGIVIDDTNFSAVEFEAMFVLEGQSVPVRFPVVSPKWGYTIEVVPASELEARLVEAERINKELAAAVELPPQLKLPGLNLQLQGLNFQRAGDGDGELDAKAPPIPALIVIPGQIGFLNQFFSVQVYTGNAAPVGSGVNVHDIQATIVLPPGKDGQPATRDDPVRMARVGPDAQVMTQVPVRGVGQDGQAGTPDDEIRIRPGQTAQGEFLVEGLRAGLHVLEIQLDAVLDGYAHGEVAIQGKAAGSILVRDARFSVALSHPRTVRTGEPYTASVTVMNTSEVARNLVSVNLAPGNISGARLADGQAQIVELGTILPGESQTAEFRLVSLRTGSVRFTNFTSGDGVTGRFDFTMGVDERGVALSAGVIGYPRWVRHVPTALMRKADRVLGQALSTATAGQLPPGVRAVTMDTVRTRVIELAEAGQRILYGDPEDKVLMDLLLDWHGGRAQSLGFDQILRETEAGAEFRAALSAELAGLGATGHALLAARATDLAGRGESWGIAAASVPAIVPYAVFNGLRTDSSQLLLPESGSYTDPTASGGFLVVRDPTASSYDDVEVGFEVPAGAAPGTVSWTELAADGTGRRFEWSVSADPTRSTCFRFLPRADTSAAIVDLDCDTSSDGVAVVSVVPLVEASPTVLAAIQDLDVWVQRPWPWCGGPSYFSGGETRDYQNYGTVVAILFSKPVSQASVEARGAFRLAGGGLITGASVQPGGRVVLVNLASGVGTFKAASMDIQGVADPRGNALGATTVPITTNADIGVSVQGQVVAADGTPVGGIPVTLTMLDVAKSGPSCVVKEPRISQVTSAPDGTFKFDFVTGAMGYRISATDTRGLNPEAVAILMEASPTGTLDPAELEAQLRTPGGPQALQDAFEGIDLDGSIAAAEGVDRAVFQDHLPPNSPRLGSIVPVALRFRGRGTVRGTVYEPDGLTPVADAAVNLFPDTSSRELGRGVFSAQDGTFEFYGVPLGTFTVDVETSDRRRRVVAARLITAGQVEELDIVVSDIPPALAQISGVILNDDLTPNVGALVVARNGEGQVVATSDADGLFSLEDVPAGFVTTLTAISFDGGRSVKRVFSIPAGATLFQRLVFPALATVSGHVFMPDGRPAVGALVAGGQTIVTADAQGAFTLQGVPVGDREISAGLPADPANNRPFTKVGAARLEVIPGNSNYVDVRLRAVGRIHGTVRDAQGNPVTGINVAIPSSQGFYWTPVDGNGHYSFVPLGLGDYLLSAPAPPIVDVEGFADALGSLDAAQIRSALADTLTLYASGFVDTGPPPAGFGYTRAALVADDQDVTADITFLEEGTVSGIVLNHQGTPIGARVELSATTRGGTGSPVVKVLGETLSNPATGEFSLQGVTEGPFHLIARSPFYLQPAVFRGARVRGQNIPDVVLQFPAPTPDGVLEVLVLEDGAPVASAEIHIDYLSGLDVMTSTAGVYRRSLPAGSTYTITAIRGTVDHGNGPQPTGRQGRATAQLRPGATNSVVIQYLAEDAALDVLVRDEGGAPIPGASVTVERVGKPNQGLLALNTDAVGHALFTALLEGPYAITACHQPGQTQVCTRGAQDAVRGTTSPVTLTMAPTATIQGFFADADGSGVEFGQVVVGRVAVATTGSGATAGQFTVPYVPLGRYALEGVNSLDGRRAQAQVVLSTGGQVAQVLLTTAVLGEISGHVLASDGTTPAAGAPVTVDSRSPLFGSLTVTTDPAGSFLLPGVPPGDFTLSARDPVVPSAPAVRVPGTMPDPGRPIVQDLTLPVRADLVVVAEREGSLTPVAARVSLNGVSQDTDATGRATFTRLLLGTYTLRAQSLEPGRTHSEASSMVIVDSSTPAPFHIALPGIGTVSGHVTDAQGANVGPGVPVTVDATTAIMTHVLISTQTDASGYYTVGDIPVGPVVARAASVALGGVTHGVAQAEVDTTLDIQLGAAADLSGRLVGSTGPVSGASILLQYTSQTAALGASSTLTSPAGDFTFSGVPVGDVTFSSYVPALDGVLHRTITITAGTHDLGDLQLDEEQPQVTFASPVDGATDVAVSTAIQVDFSEAMDTVFHDARTAYLLGPNGTVAVDMTWPTDQQLVLTPLAPLTGETQYTVVIVAGEVQQSSGAPAAGPTDLAGRYLSASWASTFTTGDAIPPQLVSLTPADGATQVDPSGVVRAQFSEPMTPDAQLTVLDAQGNPVAGTTAYDASQQVLVFAPSAGFGPNQHYVATLHGSTSGAPIRDLAGNQLVDAQGALVDSVSVAFDSVDTLGPTVIGFAPLQTPVSGAQITLLVQLAPANASEAGFQIEATTDLQTYHRGNIDSLQVTIPPLPPGGPHQVLARGIDAYGNVGPWYTGSVTVNANAPPTISITQTAPASGPLLTGQAYGFRVLAQDDGTIASLDVQLTGAFTDSYSGSHGDVILAGDVPDVGPGQVTIVATAVDSSGASVTSAPLVVGIADGLAPSLAVAPPPGLVVDPGATIAFDIAASDAFGLTSVVLNTPGATPASQSAPLQPGTSWQGVLQATAPTGPTAATIAASVTVTDVTGLSTTQPYTIAVRDTVPPVVTSVVPADGATGVATTTNVSLAFSEQVTGVEAALTLEAPPGMPVPATVTYYPSTKTANLTPTSALALGTTYTVRVSSGIVDLGGQPLAPFTTTFTTTGGGEAGPRLLAIRPLDGETAVSVLPTIELEFDAPIARTTVPSSVVLERVSTGAVVSTSYAFANLDQLLRFTPSGVLVPGEVYRITVDGTRLRGTSNLRIRDAATGLNFATRVQTFTVRVIAISLAGQALAAAQNLGVDGLGVEGYSTPATLQAEPGATISSATWYRDNNWEGTTSSAPHEFDIPLPTYAVTAGGQAAITAWVTISGVPNQVPVGPAIVGVVATSGDTDSDGMTNGTEAQVGLDPWRDDSGENPDQDGWTNLVEVNNGTDPFNRDTDFDGTNDDLDPLPLDGARPTVAGAPTSAGGIRIAGLGAVASLPATARLQAPFTWEFLLVAETTTGSGVIFDSGSNHAVVVDFDAATNIFGLTLDGSTGSPTRLVGYADWACSVSTPCHVAFTHDGAEVRLFVNGNLKAVRAHGSALAYAPADIVSLVGGVGPLTFYEIRLWSAARTLQQVRGDMLRRVADDAASLVSSWHQSDPLLQTIIDSGPAGQDGWWTDPSVGPESSTSCTVLTDVHHPATPPTGRGTPYDGLDPNFVPSASRLEYLFISKFPSNGRIYLASGPASSPTLTSELGPPAAVFYQNTNAYIQYVPNAGFYGADRYEYAYFVRGPVVPGGTDVFRVSIPAVVSFEIPPPKTWTPVGGSGDWTDAANWTPVGVPTTTDSLLIPAASTPPTLTGAVQIDSLIVEASASVDLAGQVLTAGGHVRVDGALTGGTLVLSGTGAPVNLQGNVESLDIQRDVILSADLQVAQNLAIAPLASMTLGAHTVHVLGNWSGHLPTFTNAASVMDVDGNLDVAPDAGACGVSSSPTLGELRIGGNATFTCPQVLHASGSHRMIIDGLGPQSLDTPGSALEDDRYQIGSLSALKTSGVTYFRDVVVSNTAGPVTFVRSIAIDGTLRLDPGVSVVLGGRRSVIADIDLAPGSSLVSGLAVAVENTTTVGDNATLQVGSLSLGGATTVGAGGTLSASGVLQVTGALIADATASVNSGHLVLSGSASGAAGLLASVPFTDLTIDRYVVLAGPLDVPGSLSIGPNGTLVPANQRANILGGDLIVDGALAMINPGDLVDVAGDITFNSFQTQLLEGTLTGGGDFTVAAGSLIATGGLHMVRLHGAGSTFSAPGSLIRNVTLNGNMTLASDLRVDNLISTGNVNGGSHAITVGINADLGGMSVTVDSIQVGRTLTLQPGTAVVALTSASIGELLGGGSLSTISLTFGRSSAAPATLPSGLQFTNLDLGGHVVLSQDVTLPVGGRLRVLNDAESMLHGVLEFAGHRLSATTSQVSGELLMDIPGSELLTTGSLSFNCGNSVLQQGRIVVGGDFTQLRQPSYYYNPTDPGCGPQFSVSANHELVFNGSAPQTVALLDSSMAGPLRLGKVRIAAGSQVTLPAPTAVPQTVVLAGDLVMELGSTLTPSMEWTLDVGGGVDLPATAQLAGFDRLRLGSDAYLLDGLFSVNTIELAGSAISLDDRVSSQNVVVSSDAQLLMPVTLQNLDVVGTLDTNGQDLTIAGDLSVAGAITMTNAQASVAVGGNATFGASYTPTPLVTTSNLQAGTIDVAGDFTAVASTFPPGVGHTTILSGSGATIDFSQATQLSPLVQYSHFGQLQIPGSVTFTTNATVLQDLTVSGTATVNASRTLSIGGLLTVDPGGTLNNNGTVNPGSCALNGTINPPGSVVCP